MKIIRIQQRIAALLLAWCILIGCVLVTPLRVQAVALPVDADLGLEFTMMLYNLMETAMIAGGVREGLDDYNTGASLYEAFNTFILSATTPDVSGLDDCLVTLSDGSTVRVGDLRDALDAMQINTSVLPNEETFHRFRVIKGGAGGTDPDPEEDPGEDPFSRIQKIALGTGALAQLGTFASQVFSGAVAGADAALLFNDGEYFFSGIWPEYYQGDMVSYDSGDILQTKHYYGLCDKNYFIYFDGSNRRVCIAYFDFEADSLCSATLSCTQRSYRNGVLTSVIENASSYNYSYIRGSINLPVFSSLSDAHSFFRSMESRGLLNGLALDFGSIIAAIPETLTDPLADKAVMPSGLRRLAEAMKQAVVDLPDPEPGTDPAEAAEPYKQAVKQAATEIAPQLDPYYGTSTNPVPDPGGDPLPEELPDLNNYKTDLTSIFPFCLPFDLIRFLEALDADPVAPHFEIPFVVEAVGIHETIVLDMSIFEDVAVVIRIGELGLFVVGLIAITRNVIKW